MRKLKNIKQIKIFREPFSGTMLLTIAPIALFVILFQIRKFKPDIIHAHGNLAFFYYIFRHLFKSHKIPLVLHLHNTTAGRIEVGKKMKLKTSLINKIVELPLNKLSDGLGVKTASFILCPSTKVKEEIIKFYKPKDVGKIKVVESGVNIDLFKKDIIDRREFRSRMGISGKKVILHLGAIIRRKNPHLLINALKYLPSDCILLIVGPGDKDYIIELKEMTAGNDLSERVKLVGYTPYKDSASYFRSADVFALPSAYEGLPKVVIQSLAAGVPVVASGFIVREDIKGLEYLDNLDPKHIAGKIKNVFDSGVKVDTETIKNKFSWDVKAKEIEEVYEKILRD